MSEWCYGSCTIISQIGFVRGPLRDVAHREGCLPSPSFILLYFFFISSFGVKQTYNWHRLFFTLSLTLSLFCSLCVCVCPTRQTVLGERAATAAARRQDKKIYKKMRLDSNREFGVGGGGPETWRNSYFFFLSLCVCLAYALPPILSFL